MPQTALDHGQRQKERFNCLATHLYKEDSRHRPSTHTSVITKVIFHLIQAEMR